MKKILGLDLGTASIGWALVNEAEAPEERSNIIQLGVRVNPLTVDELQNFEKGKSITTNAERTLKRGMRRNLQRYKLRRTALINTLRREKLVNDETIFSEEGNHSTFYTYRQRAEAAVNKVSLDDFARVLLMINKKRGYKSSRKVKNKEEGHLIDGMSIARHLYDNNLTPGQYMLQLLIEGKNIKPDFYRSDLKAEFDRIWEKQREYYPEILTNELKTNLDGKNEGQTWKICEKPFQIVGVKRTTKGAELLKENYIWRSEALSKKIDLESLAIVFQKINGQINNSSGYLGAISDRSKELYFNQQSVGQYLYEQIVKNPHSRLKGQVFYRQDYLDEFEKIWEEQAKHYPQLTPELKSEIRDTIIFHQRRLKSQKGLISICEFESHEISVHVNGSRKTKTIGPRVAPRSSPLFQEFKIWQTLNNVEVSVKSSTSKRKKKGPIPILNPETEDQLYKAGRRPLHQEEKETLAKELSIKEKLTKAEILKLLFNNPGELDLNFKEIQGNHTIARLFETYKIIIDQSGHELDPDLPASGLIEGIRDIFKILGYNTEILSFNSNSTNLDKEPVYQLWHLLYSYEDDNSKSGIQKLVSTLQKRYGFEEYAAKLLANTSLLQDYCNLSAKAIKKILPYLKEGNSYDVACMYAGYNHSNSLTTEENLNRELKERLEILPKNSLRNPVVEKIINQMINLVNTIIDTHGKPDEIRIELARELKKSAKEREEIFTAINKSNREHEEYRKILQSPPYNLRRVTRNDLIRYKLWKELEPRGYKSLYTDTYIAQEKLFSGDFDIDHIIPQARLFDDSFSNKTLEKRQTNIDKGNKTAYDFISDTYGEEGIERYKLAIEELALSIAKKKKLLMHSQDIPEDFLNRDLGNTQYIVRKARQILLEVFSKVNTTTGSITERLREDWQLVNLLQELNWNKFKALGLTYYEKDRDGRQIPRITGWSKRNDHRHHAMDALTVAFTKHSHVQYLNNLNARSDKASSIYGIEQKELTRTDKGRLVFKPPIPIDDFRAEAKEQLERILVSYKTKNKVTTKNRNRIRNGEVQKTLTPRGQLHLETVYGTSYEYNTHEIKVGSNFDESTIRKVANKKYREALLSRLNEMGGDPKKAFTGANALNKKPIYLNTLQTEVVPERVKVVSKELRYTIRKDISPDLKIDKVIDVGIRRILQERLFEFNGDSKKAFSNLEENPIWLDKSKTISIKRVTINGVTNAIPLHDKKDKDGKKILDDNGMPQPVDFVNTGNNHHVAVYRDSAGNLQENVISFMEATARATQGLPVIDKGFKKDEGWIFLFSMKQNEYFVHPNEQTGFYPMEKEVSWFYDPENYKEISTNLFRVQKFSFKNYVFRHHLETTVADFSSILKRITWIDFRSSSGLDQIRKVRINHLGHIVGIGEY